MQGNSSCDSLILVQILVTRHTGQPILGTASMPDLAMASMPICRDDHGQLQLKAEVRQSSTSTREGRTSSEHTALTCTPRTQT